MNPDSSKFRPDFKPLLSLVFTYLCIMDTKSDVERLVSKFCWLTIRHRACNMKLFAITDALRVVTPLPSEPRSYVSFAAHVPPEGATQRGRDCTRNVTTEAGGCGIRALYVCTMRV